MVACVERQGIKWDAVDRENKKGGAGGEGSGSRRRGPTVNRGDRVRLAYRHGAWSWKYLRVGGFIFRVEI